MRKPIPLMCSEIQTKLLSPFTLDQLPRIPLPTLHPLQYLNTIMLSLPPRKLPYTLIIIVIYASIFLFKQRSQYYRFHDIHPCFDTFFVCYEFERHGDSVHFVQEFE